MGQGGIKKPEDTTLQPRSLRKPHPVSVPTMAWTVLLLGLLAYGSGQGKGLCILRGHVKAMSPGDLFFCDTRVSHVVFRGKVSDCGDPAAIAVSVPRRDVHTHLWS